MKKFSLLVVVCCTLLSVMPASAQFLSFNDVDFDYGLISSSNVNSRATFTCINRGTYPIIITKVVPSTDAITCNVSRDTLDTGERSAISISFNPQNYKSLFREYVDVYTTDQMLPKITLTLTGTVKDLDTEIEKKYPSVFDAVRLSKLNINFNKIYYPAVVTDTVWVYNPQDTAVTLVFPNVPNYMTVKMFPETIQPNSSAMMLVSYNSGERKEWGNVYDKLYMGFQGKRVNYKMRISISGTITEDFSKLTKSQIKNAPKISFVTDTFNFGTVHQGDPVECQFHFTNEGKSTLEIRKIKTSCGCTAGSMDKMSYLQGEDGVVNVTLNTRSKNGNVRQTITIISNDPVHPESRVFIQGVVVVPE